MTERRDVDEGFGVALPKRGLWHWLFGKHPPRPPRPDHVIELAWLPLWQAQLVLHHLWEAGIPTTMSEDHTAMIRASAREPMARLFVMEERRDAALAAMRELEAAMASGELDASALDGTDVDPDEGADADLDDRTP